jgi:methyl-accepting chemotaxis protein
MVSTLGSVQGATELTRESDDELKAIVVSVDTSAMRVGDIVEVAKEQSSTTREVITAVEQSSEMTSLVIADMENVSVSVQSLATRANDLRSLVEELTAQKES